MGITLAFPFSAWLSWTGPAVPGINPPPLCLSFHNTLRINTTLDYPSPTPFFWFYFYPNPTPLCTLLLPLILSYPYPNLYHTLTLPYPNPTLNLLPYRLPLSHPHRTLTLPYPNLTPSCTLLPHRYPWCWWSYPSCFCRSTQIHSSGRMGRMAQRSTKQQPTLDHPQYMWYGKLSCLVKCELWKWWRMKAGNIFIYNTPNRHILSTHSINTPY